MKKHFMAKKVLSLVLTAGMILSVFASSPSFVYATEGEIDQNGIETPLDEMDNADAPLVTAIPGLSEKEEDTQVIQEGDPENTEENVSPDNVIENDEVPGKGDPENIPDDETPENIPDDEVTDEQTPEKQVPADEDPEDSAPQENENADAGEGVNADKDQEQKQEIPDAPQDVTEPAADTQQPGSQQEQPVTQEPNAEDKASQETEPEKTEPEKTEPKKTELENTTTTTEKKEIKAAEEKQKEEKQEEKEEPVYTDGKLIAKGSDFEITLTYGADAKIPEDAVLSAVEILEQHDVYETCVDKAAEKVYEEDDAVEEKPAALPYARFFDITILSADGEVIEPAAEVKVIIDLKDDALQTEDVNFTAVHFVEEETRAAEEAPAADTEEPVIKTETVEKAQAELIAIEPENLGTSDADSVVEIAAESFSIYGVVYYYTVDFYYTSNDGDGEATTAEYHMNGGTEMMLSELFTKLGIDRDAAEVTDVDFTDDSLVTFTQEGSDWRIKSLKPFTTSEVLTITFEDGSSIVIGVEDAFVVGGGAGQTVYWWIDSKADGTNKLIIRANSSGSWNGTIGSGEGYLRSYGENTWPWNSYKSSISEVDFQSTIHAGNSIAYMFAGFEKLEKITHMEYFDTSQTEEMQRVFSGCKALTELDLSNWTNDGKVFNMQNMFNGCTSLESVVLNNPDFKTRVSSQATNAGSGTDGCQVSGMFSGCNSLKTVDMSNITIGGRNNQTAQEFENMFSGLTSLESVDMSNIKLPGMKSLSGMFEGCTELKSVDFSGNIDVVDAEYMTNMFNGCSALKELDVSSFGMLPNIVNMNGFVEGCTALETLNIDDMDNSAIGPTNGRHSITEGLPPSIGASEYGRQLGIETCTALQTLSAKNSRVWMCYNNRGLPGNEYYNASNDGDALNNGDIFYFTKKAAQFASDAGPTVMIESKRDYIDLITDRDGTPENTPALAGTSDIADRGTNINIKNGDLNTNGAGFLAPGVYTLNQGNWSDETIELPDTYYRISYIGQRPYSVTGSNPELEIVQRNNGQNTWINTKNLQWPASGNYTIDNVNITLTYENAAIDVNGKLHDVAITINSVTFKDLDRVPTISSNRGSHDGNKYVPDDRTYYRTVVQATQGDGLHLRNYVYTGDPTNPDRYTSCLSGGSGTDIDFTVKIVDAKPDTSFVFYVDDLDVAAKQKWNYPVADDPCYDNLPITNVTYGQGGESFELKNGETAIFADKTGLVQEGSEILTTGSDPSTSWSEFAAVSDAYNGGNYIWKSGIACSTYALRDTEEINTGKLIFELKAKKVLTGGKLSAGDFTFEMTESGINPSGAPSPTGATFPVTVSNESDGTVNFGTLTFEHKGGNSLIYESTRGTKTYFPGTLPSGNTHGGGEHNTFTYNYNIKEVPGSDPHIVYNVNNDEYDLKIVIKTPENDTDMYKGIKAEIFINGSLLKEVWSKRDNAELVPYVLQIGDFTNRVKTNDVSVKKETIGNKTGSFDFLITFDKPKTEYDPSAEGVEGITEDTSATAAVSGSAWKFSLENGKNIVFPNVPLGTTYSVKEIPSANGFELESVDGDATKTTATNKVSVEKDDPNYKGEYDHTFLNRRTELVVKKTVSKGDKTKNFTFSANAEVSGLAANSTFSYGVIDASGEETYDFGQADANGNASITFNRFQISDAKSAKLVVPLNAKVTVTEIDPGEYDVYVAEGTASKTEGDTITVTADTDGKEITFTNVGPLAYTEITVEKQIEKGDTSLKFNFTAQGEISGLMPGKTFAYGWANDEGQEEYDEATADANGKAKLSFKAFSLADDESVRLSVPQGAQVTITEAKNNDYEVTVAEDGGTVKASPSITVSTIDKETTMVVFTNTSTKPVVPPTGDDAVSEDYKGKPQTGTPSFKVGQPDTPSGGANKIEKIVLLDALGNEAPGNKIVVSGEGTYELDPATGTVTFTPEPEFVGKAKGVGVRAYDSNYEYGQSLDPKINCYVDVKYTPTVKVKVSYVDPLTGQTVQGPTDSYVKEGKDVTTTYETEDESKYGKEESKNHPNHIFDGWEQTVDPEDPSHYIRTAKYMPVYTITYDPNGGEGEMDNNTYRQDDPEKPIDKNKFTKPEHKFTGFYGYVTDPETGEETLITGEDGEPILFDGTADMNEYFKGIDDTWLPAGTTIRMEAQWEKGEEPEPEPEPEKDDEPEPEPDKPAPGPRYTLHISGTKTWIDEGYKSGKRPQAVIVRLYADGQEIAQRAVSFATGGTENSDIWTFDFGEHDMYKAGVPIRYTLTEDTLEGYTTQITSNYQKVEEVKGSRLTFSVVNTAGEKRSAARTTGDESRMLLWGLIAMAAVAGLILFVSKQRRRG